MERDLVEAAQRGDREAYVDLIRSRADHLYALTHRILRDVDRAEDAFQDALVIAWRGLAALRDPDRLDAWLRRLFVNVCLEHATRERRRIANLRVLPADGPAAPDELRGIADRDQLERGFGAAAARAARHPRPASLRGLRPLGDRRAPRDPRRHGPLPTPQRPSRHARCPRRGRPVPSW